MVNDATEYDDDFDDGDEVPPAQTIQQKTLAALSSTTCSSIPVEQLEHTNAVFFEQLSRWSAKHLPMGNGAVTQRHLERGVKIVGLELRNNAQKYGVDPITVITLVSGIISIINHIVQWWNRREA